MTFLKQSSQNYIDLRFHEKLLLVSGSKFPGLQGKNIIDHTQCSVFNNRKFSSSSKIINTFPVDMLVENLLMTSCEDIKKYNKV